MRGGRWGEGGLLLGLVRGLALTLALALFLFLTGRHSVQSFGFMFITLVAVYTIGRIIYPFYWLRGARLAYLLLTIDVLISCGIVFINHSSDNSFILYPLTAILASAIYFPQKVTYAVASVCSALAVVSEIIPLVILNNGGPFPAQLYVVLMAIYVIVAFLIAWLPYVGNINLSATIRHRAILEERGRLSRELHDGPAQRLAVLIMKLDEIRETVSDTSNYQLLSELTGFRHDLQECHLEVREVIDQLRMIRLPESASLLPTLAQYTREFSYESGIPCHVYLADGYTDLDPLATVELLRVVQEALTNVRKHSGANQVEVRFESLTNQVKIVIKDNGCGFVPTTADHHHGISVMKERAKSLDGDLQIVSQPGKGTEIQVTVPVNRKFGGKNG